MRASALLAMTVMLGAVEARPQELPCRLDGRLLPAARAALADERVDAATLRALTEAASLRAPDVLAWRAQGGDADARLERMRAWISSRAPLADGPRCAVVIVGDLAAVALAPRAAEVVELPPRDGVRAWRVALPAGATDPTLLVAPDDGPLLRLPIDAQGAVSARVEGAATFQVALVREGDVQLWSRWREGPARLREAPALLGARDVLRATNGLRAGEGRGALRGDPLLARVAEGYAGTLAAARRVGHALDGDPTERLARNGIRARVVGEVVARSPTLAGAFDALGASPAHRAVLLEPSVETAGVGVATADGQVYLVVMLAAGAGLGAAAP